MGEGGGASSTSVPQRSTTVVGDLAGGDPDPERLGGRGYLDIVLVEVIWKSVEVILNCRFTAIITYHDLLHGFRAGCGTGTATLELNILQQVAAFREEVLHVIFLDLHKAHDALYRSRCLGILEGYGVVPRALRLLQLYWVRLRMVARLVGYYGAPFCIDRGVTQGYPLLPTIFNVVVDAVFCHWEFLLVAEQEGGESSGDKGDGAQTSVRTIRNRDDRKQWAEEVHQRLTVKANFFMPTMGWSLSQTQDGSSWRSIC